MNGRLVLSQWYDRRHRANPLIDCQTSQGLGAGADAGPTAVSCHYVLRIKFFFHRWELAYVVDQDLGST